MVRGAQFFLFYKSSSPQVHTQEQQRAALKTPSSSSFQNGSSLNLILFLWLVPFSLSCAFSFRRIVARSTKKGKNLKSALVTGSRWIRFSDLRFFGSRAALGLSDLVIGDQSHRISDLIFVFGSRGSRPL